MEALLDGEAEAITRVAVEKAKEGDATALRLCLERILPPRKDRPVSFSPPQLGTVTEAPAATAAIVAAVAAADITVSEGSELARLVDSLIARTHWPPLRVARDAPSKEPAASLCFLCTIRGHSICYFSVKITQMASRSRHRTQATDRARSSTKAACS